MREAFRVSVEMSTASLFSRLMEVADSARTIRLNASSEAIVLKAGAAELQTLTVLATRMGVEVDSTAQMAEDAMLLASVVGKLARGRQRRIRRKARRAPCRGWGGPDGFFHALRVAHRAPCALLSAIPQALGWMPGFKRHGFSKDVPRARPACWL